MSLSHKKINPGNIAVWTRITHFFESDFFINGASLVGTLIFLVWSAQGNASVFPFLGKSILVVTNESLFAYLFFLEDVPHFIAVALNDELLTREQRSVVNLMYTAGQLIDGTRTINHIVDAVRLLFEQERDSGLLLGTTLHWADVEQFIRIAATRLPIPTPLPDRIVAQAGLLVSEVAIMITDSDAPNLTGSVIGNVIEISRSLPSMGIPSQATSFAATAVEASSSNILSAASSSSQIISEIVENTSPVSQLALASTAAVAVAASAEPILEAASTISNYATAQSSSTLSTTTTTISSALQGTIIECPLTPLCPPSLPNDGFDWNQIWKAGLVIGATCAAGYIVYRLGRYLYDRSSPNLGDSKSTAGGEDPSATSTKDSEQLKAEVFGDISFPEFLQEYSGLLLPADHIRLSRAVFLLAILVLTDLRLWQILRRKK